MDDIIYMIKNKFFFKYYSTKTSNFQSNECLKWTLYKKELTVVVRDTFLWQLLLSKNIKNQCSHSVIFIPQNMFAYVVVIVICVALAMPCKSAISSVATFLLHILHTHPYYCRILNIVGSFEQPHHILAYTNDNI